MNISEKAKAYAEGKAVSALTIAIEAAYADGYNAGFADGLASKEGEKPDNLDDGVEYVDLGLPSGTKWAAGYLKDNEGNTIYMAYDEAVKYKIPTEEQIVELIKNCIFVPVPYNPDTQEMDGYKLVSKNGKFVTYLQKGYYNADEIRYIGDPLFWIKRELPDNEKCRFAAWLGGREMIARVFRGSRLPVILVQ